MNTLERVIASAQADANRCNKPLAILNLNRIGRHLYVIREWKDQYNIAGYADAAGFVRRIDPVQS